MLQDHNLQPECNPALATQTRVESTSNERATSISRTEGMDQLKEEVDKHIVVKTPTAEPTLKTERVDPNSRQRASSRSRVECVDVSTEETAKHGEAQTITKAVATSKLDASHKSRATSQSRQEGLSADEEITRECNTKGDIIKGIQDTADETPHKPVRQKAVSRVRSEGFSSKEENLEQLVDDVPQTEKVGYSHESMSKQTASSLSRVEGLDIAQDICRDAANKKEFSAAMEKSAGVKTEPSTKERVIVSGNVMGCYDEHENVSTLNTSLGTSEATCNVERFTPHERSRASSKTRVEGFTIDGESYSEMKVAQKQVPSVQAQQSLVKQQKTKITSKERLEGVCNTEEETEVLKDINDIITSIEDQAMEKRETNQRVRASSKSRIEGFGTNTEESKQCSSQGDIISSIQEKADTKSHKVTRDRALSKSRLEGIDDEAQKTDQFSASEHRVENANVTSSENKFSNITNQSKQFGFSMDLSETRDHIPTAMPQPEQSSVSKEIVDRRRVSSMTRQEGYGTSIEDTNKLITTDRITPEKKKARESKSSIKSRATSQSKSQGFLAPVDEPNEMHIEKESEVKLTPKQVAGREPKERAISATRTEGFHTPEQEAKACNARMIEGKVVATQRKEAESKQRASSKARREGVHVPENTTSDMEGQPEASTQEFAKTSVESVSRNIPTNTGRIEGMTNELEELGENITAKEKYFNAKKGKEPLEHFHRPTSQIRLVGFGTEVEQSKTDEFPLAKSVIANVGKETMHQQSRASSRPRQLGAYVKEESTEEGLEFKPEKVSARESRASKFEKSKIISKSKQQGVIVAGEEAESVEGLKATPATVNICILKNDKEVANASVVEQGFHNVEESAIAKEADEILQPTDISRTSIEMRDIAMNKDYQHGIKTTDDVLEDLEDMSVDITIAKEISIPRTVREKAVQESKQVYEHENTQDKIGKVSELDLTSSATENLEVRDFAIGMDMKTEVQDQGYTQEDSASAFDSESGKALKANLIEQEEDRSESTMEKPDFFQKKPVEKSKKVILSTFHNFRIKLKHEYSCCSNFFTIFNYLRFNMYNLAILVYFITCLMNLYAIICLFI